MLKFLKSGKEFQKLAEAFNGLNLMLQDLIKDIEKSNNYSDFEEDILTLSYIARKGVLDRIEHFNWSMNTKILVPSIDRNRITLMYAYTQTVGKLEICVLNLEMKELFDEIMEKGEVFYEIENNFSPETINKI